MVDRDMFVLNTSSSLVVVVVVVVVNPCDVTHVFITFYNIFGYLIVFLEEFAHSLPLLTKNNFKIAYNLNLKGFLYLGCVFSYLAGHIKKFFQRQSWT